MSKSLRSMSNVEREKAVYSRRNQPEGQRGLGYWGAMDAPIGSAKSRTSGVTRTVAETSE